MNINFIELNFKNVCSYGNKMQTFVFNNGLDISTAKNGEGKSTIWTALYYALFGKADKNIKLKNLVNNINNKNLYVELKFIISENKSHVYTIKRGMYPHIFEIYKDENLIPQLPSTREYQEFLETNILNFNSSTFKQLISITANLNSYKPFVDLSQTERENLLQIIIDTNIFNFILQEAKQEYQEYLTIKTELEYKLDVQQKAYRIEENNIHELEILTNNLKEQNDNRENDIKKEIREIKKNIENINKLKEKVIEKSEALNNIVKTIDSIKEKKKIIQDKIQDENILLTKISNVKEQFKLCGSCPTVAKLTNVDISEKENIEKKINSYNSALEKIDNKLIELEPKIQTFNKIQTALEVYEKDLLKNEQKIQKLQNSLDEIKKNQILPKINYDNFNHIKNEIERLTDEIKDNNTIIRKYENIMSKFKDKKFKGVILQQSLPALNKFINKYLEKFEAQFGAILKPDFSLQIFSQKSEDIQINQLSNGEKFRLNFSILFGMLKFLEMKSNIKINLLVLDEVLDSSLDVSGRNKLLEVLKYEFVDKNIVLITHNTDIKSMSNMFNRVISIEKNVFSEINITTV